jgi:hypothetical protein
LLIETECKYKVKSTKIFRNKLEYIRIYLVHLYVYKTAMEAKLTLKFDQTVIEKAKNYAKAHQTSLSKLIENYLHYITNEKKEDDKITPLVKSLTGIIHLPKDYDSKKEYAEYLMNKYK